MLVGNDLEDSGIPRMRELVEHLTDARIDLEVLFVLSRDLMCVANASGYFKQVNPAWTKMLGWSKEDLTSQPFINFIHPDDIRDTQRVLGEMVNSDCVVFVNRYRTTTGKYRQFEWNASRWTEGYTYAVARDVTDKPPTKFGALMCDTDQHIVFSDTVAGDLFGHSTLVGKHLQELIPRNDRVKHDRDFNQFLLNGQPDRILGICRGIRGVCKDGQNIPVWITVNECNLEGKRYFLAVVALGAFYLPVAAGGPN